MTSPPAFGSGGSTTTPQYQQTDVPGVAFDVRSGQYIDAFTGSVISFDEYLRRAASASPAQKFTPPQIEYDAQGQAYYWAPGQNGQPNRVRRPDLDDPTKAAGYRPPSTAQPPQPVTYTDPRTGDIVGIDPRSGAEMYRVPGATYAQLSPQEQRQIDLGDIAAARRYQTSERMGSEAFQSGQNALDRAIRAGDIAASINLQNEANRFSADQAYQVARERFTERQLAGAQQVADNISNIDPGALPAFYAAGGGVIANALARGGTAQSDLANLGSARALQAIEMAAHPERFTFNPVQFDPNAFLNFGQVTPNQQQKAVTQTPYTTDNVVSLGIGESAPMVNTNTGQTQTVTNYGTPTGALSALTPDQYAQVPDFVKTATAAGTTGAGAANTTPSTGKSMNEQLQAHIKAGGTYSNFTPRFAFGTGDIPAPPRFITGDSTDPANPAAGGARPELIEIDDPTGDATVSVDPLVPPEAPSNEGKMGTLFRAIADFLDGGEPPVPRFAYGTADDPTGMMGGVQPSDQPYLDRIRDIRTNVDYNRENPFDVGFDLLPPTLANRFFAGRQTQFGVPVADQVAEYQRFRLPGASRGAFSLGF